MLTSALSQARRAEPGARRVAKRLSRVSVWLGILSCNDHPLEARAVPGSIAWTLPSVVAPPGSATLSTDGQHVFAHADVNRIVSVRLSDRAVVWTAAADETLSTPGLRGVAFCGGHVVFSSYLALYGAASTTGSRQWRRLVPGTTLYSTPVCHDGTVYITSSISARAVYAIDPSIGTPRWVTQLPAISSDRILWGPTVSDEVVAVCTRILSVPFAGELAILDRRTGAIRWRTTLSPARADAPSGCRYPPAVAGDLVVANLDDGRLEAYDVATGAPRWSAPGAYESPNALDERPLGVSGDVVFAGSLRGFVIGYDARTGQERWRWILGDGVGSIVWGNWAVDGSTIVGSNTSGSVIALDARSGQRLWVVPKGIGLNERGFWPTGVFAQGLYIGATTSGLVAIRR
jgi:outer membrane protein assembly factor BamB